MSLIILFEGDNGCFQVSHNLCIICLLLSLLLLYIHQQSSQMCTPTSVTAFALHILLVIWCVVYLLFMHIMRMNVH